MSSRNAFNNSMGLSIEDLKQEDIVCETLTTTGGDARVRTELVEGIASIAKLQFDDNGSGRLLLQCEGNGQGMLFANHAFDAGSDELPFIFENLSYSSSFGNAPALKIIEDAKNNKSIIQSYDIGNGAEIPLEIKTTGVTVSGNLSVSGNLTVTGDTTTVETKTLSVTDPLIQLAVGNAAASDLVDQGLYGEYKNSGTKYWALYRDASDSGYFRLDNEITDVPTTTITPGTLANLNVGNLRVGSTNVLTPTLVGNLAALPVLSSGVFVADPCTTSTGTFARTWLGGNWYRIGDVVCFNVNYQITWSGGRTGAFTLPVSTATNLTKARTMMLGQHSTSQYSVGLQWSSGSTSSVSITFSPNASTGTSDPFTLEVTYNIN